MVWGPLIRYPLRIVCNAHLNQIHFIESLIIAGSLDIQDGDNVLVVEIAQQLHFTECAQTKHGVVEWSNLLDRDLLARWLVDGGTIII